ncbi:MAG: hypothetical protein AAGE80_18070 [Pseudomonadota bacterium]
MGEMNSRTLRAAHEALMAGLEQPEARRASKLNPALVPGSEPDQDLMVELLGSDYYRLLEPAVARDPIKPPRIYPPQTGTQRAIDEAMILHEQGMIEVVEAWRCQV